MQKSVIKDNILYGPPFEMEFPYESVGEYFLENMEKHGSATALVRYFYIYIFFKF